MAHFLAGRIRRCRLAGWQPFSLFSLCGANVRMIPHIPSRSSSLC